MSVRDLQFVVLLGSLRRASHTRAIALTLDELAPDDVAVRLIGSPGELPPFNQDRQDIGFPAEVETMGAEIAAADGVVIVTPEYNHSVPGMLKNALDWLSRLPGRPFDKKLVAIQTASPGKAGGIRAQAPLREVLVAMNALVLNRPEVVVPQVAGKVDLECGLIRDDETRRVIASQLAALADLARSSDGREPTGHDREGPIMAKGSPTDTRDASSHGSATVADGHDLAPPPAPDQAKGARPASDEALQ